MANQACRRTRSPRSTCGCATIHAGLAPRAAALEQESSRSRLRLQADAPNVAFHRQIGEFGNIHATPDGVLIDDATWSRRKADWLPSADDGDFIASLMTPVTEIGEFASCDFAAQGRIDNKPAILSM